MNDIDPQVEVFNEEAESEVAGRQSPVASEARQKTVTKAGKLLLLPARATAGKLKKHWIYLKHLNLSKKQWAILIAGLLIIVCGAVFGGYKLYQHVRKAPQAATVKEQKTLPPAPKTEASNLSGAQVPIGTNKRPVTGIMIENSLDARPQSGLNQAGVVYEAIAEGGITRFLALFQDGQPDYIGPIRSARPYYLDWLLPFDASLAHVGGSPDALAAIQNLGVKNLDEFANGNTYTRISSRDAPHNVYSSFSSLDALNQAKGFTSSSFTSFPRKAEKPVANVTAGSIDLRISSSEFNVHYDYAKATNTYTRNEGGAPQRDERSGVTLAPKVVIALLMPYSLATDGLHSQYSTIGSGQMYVFQDGQATTGTWSKADHKSQFVFTDSSGAPLKLNPGQTWITVLGSQDEISYSP